MSRSTQLCIEGPTPSARPYQSFRLTSTSRKAGLALSELDAPTDGGYFHRLMFPPTLTINGFHGGYGGPDTKTCSAEPGLLRPLHSRSASVRARRERANVPGEQPTLRRNAVLKALADS
jgi:hypothetical protein